ncbi:hypothetical protein [Thermococcus sp. GR6]|uniref:hypothetical protein n=1 Tax=Thermococcus sp. GR6 TaxID=1638256 RepID=UPI001F0D4AEE|nr:hypothetical protein [Thermococcus sp. GR6]
MAVMEMNVIDIFRKEDFSGSTVSIIYDAYSSAWQISLLLLRYGLENGYFGIVSNYTIPLNAFMRKAGTVGLNVIEALKNGEMAIIDLFGSRYLSKEDIPNVFYLDKVEPETLNPKIERIYTTNLKEYLSEKPALRLIYTLDGASLMLGEDNTLKLLNQTLASRSIELPNSTLVLAINQDVVSRRFVAWVASISDYVILARSRLDEDGPREFLYLITAPYEEFEPTAYSFRVTKDKGIEKLKVRKISP